MPRISAFTAVLAASALVVAGAVTAPAGASSSSKYTLVTEPADAYHRIYSLITSAQTTLDMTMYELVDTTARNDLVADAARGVRVRVILDKNREQTNNQTTYTYLNAHGVQCVWAPAGFAATHQKTITVDGTTSAIMSGNLTSRYYATSRDFAVIDTNLVDIAAIEKVFNADFAGTAITPTDGDNLTWSPTDSQSRLLSLINSATATLQIENEEMADPAVTDALVAAARRGVDVEVTMTANSDYDSAFDQIVAAGGHVSTYPNDATSLYIHAKVIVADQGRTDADAYVGSINFSDYSLNKNRELGFITADDTIDSELSSTLTGDFAGATVYS